jgi:hypothetical protein
MDELFKLGMVALVAGVGAYIGSYMKTKGENLATHEDIDKLVEQVRAVTTTTKEIEAKISNDVWDRQKRWELKREVIFEAARRVSDIEDALFSLQSVWQVERANPKQEGGQGWAEPKIERMAKWSKATAAFDETRLMVSIVCGNEVKNACDEFGTFTTAIAGAIIKDDAEIYAKSQKELVKKSFLLKIAMRRELGIDPAA